MFGGSVPSVHCRCAACLSCTTPHPTSGVLTEGRWFTEDQYRRHRDEIQPVRFREASTSLRSTRRQTAVGGSSSASGSSRKNAQRSESIPHRDPQPSLPTLSGTKRTRSISPPPMHPSSAGDNLPPHESSDTIRLAERVEFIIANIKSPEQLSLDSSQHLYFDRPPHRHKGPMPHSDTLGELLKLDPTMPSNSPFIAYQRELDRAEDIASRHRRHPEVSIRLQVQILSDTLARYNRTVKDLLEKEWKRQYRLQYQPRLVDTSEWLLPQLSPCIETSV